MGRPRLWPVSAGILVWLATALVSPALAGETVDTAVISFGSIDLHPAGDTVVIDAANGAASPQPSGNSLVTGGRSGKISLRSDDAEHVDLIYPSSVELSDGTRALVLSEIPENSQYTDVGVDLPGGGATVDIHIGGKLFLPADTTHGTYSGSMTIILNFN